MRRGSAETTPYPSARTASGTSAGASWAIVTSCPAPAIAFASRRGSEVPRLLLTAAHQLEAVNPTVARTTYLEALAAAEGHRPVTKTIRLNLHGVAGTPLDVLRARLEALPA